MKKNLKQTLAKTLAGVMVFGLVATAMPAATADAASAPKLKAKKVTVTVKKTKKITVKGKKIKSTKWTITKGKKYIKLSKKKKTSVTVKGVKKGSATVKAKVKYGKKTKTLTCKVTVKKATPVVTKAPVTTPPVVKTPAPTAPVKSPVVTTPAVTTAPAPKADIFGTEKQIDETQTYSLDLTELNETTFTCDAKRPEPNGIHSDIDYSAKKKTVTFTSNGDYNYGISFYVNPCTDESQIVEAPERGEGYKKYEGGQKDVSDFDYIRVKLSSESEMNFRTYNDNKVLNTEGFPGTKTSETYEGSWNGPVASNDYLVDDATKTAGKGVKAEYTTRTVYIPMSMLMKKGMNPETLIAVALCPQAKSQEVTLYSIDFVKVKQNVKATSVTVSGPAIVKNGKFGSMEYSILPANVSKDTVKWTSSNPDLLSVDALGQVKASDTETGSAIITATAKDGSNVYGSKSVEVVAEAANPGTDSDNVVSIDLNDANVVAKTNPGSGPSIDSNITKSEAGIKYDGASYNMHMLDISAYLTEKGLDLTDYEQIRINGNFYDAEGNVLPCEAGKIKTALVKATDLNGWANSVLTTGQYKTFPEVTLDLTKADDAANIAQAVGFNFQPTAPAGYAYMLIESIELVKDASAPTVDAYGALTLALGSSDIVATTNPGSGPSINTNITQSAAGIKYDGASYNMHMLNIAAYLAKYDIDLTDYKQISISGNFYDAEGNVLPCEAGKIKTALVKATDLNGWANSVLTTGQYKTFPNVALDLSAEADAANIAQAVGFNFQPTAPSGYAYMMINSIKLVKDASAPTVVGTKTTLNLQAADVVAKTNPGSGPSIDTNITKDATGIKYDGASYNMHMLDISAYLAKYELDLTDYSSIEITGNFYNAEGTVLPCEAGKIKAALVKSTDLNGWANSVLTSGQYKTFPDVALDLTKSEDAANIAQAVGFNFQPTAPEGYAYMKITSVSLVK